MRRAFLFWTAWAVLAVPSARAQSWVDQVLPERSFDFGTVARGSKVRHSFRLVNRLDQDVRVLTWRTKCGCTEARVGGRDSSAGAVTIPAGTQTTVEAVIDTTKFLGPKRSGLTLVFERPNYVDVDLDLNCFIRGDIVLNPGLADFGIVSRSSSAEKPSLTLSLAYAGGQANWGVTKMQTKSAHVAAKLQEQARSADGQAQYLLTATLDPKDLSGFFKDEITLFTNDPNGPTIPVSVTANVQAAVTVTPSPLLLGSVKPGQVVKKTLLVRSSQGPFKVKGVKPSKDDLTAAPVPDDSRPVHTLSVTFKAPAQPGPYNAVFEVETDLKDEPPAKLTMFANVVP
jgi:hypothetical protein